MADDSDEDDDTFVTFGTAVEVFEEDAPRKKPVQVHEQIVTDSQGRRRFHGAFSGGFSAGYFNTVGTKEGWSPSTFVSSRSKKYDQTRQKPEDFMDEEDFSEFGIAPKKITTTGDFLPTRKDLKRHQSGWETGGDSESLGSASGKVIPGVPPLQHLVVPTTLSVGVKLLKEMGWREGQGIGPRVRRTRKKVYGCAPQPTHECSDDDDVYAVGILFAPKDVAEFSFTPKDDLHGLGYKGIDVSSALIQNTGSDILGMGGTKSYFGKVKGIKGQAFGVGAFEDEDDDIYGADSMSRYDIELTAESKTQSSSYHGWTGPPKQKQARGLLSIFAVAAKPLAARQYYPPPVLPKGYKPLHSTTHSSEEQQNVEPRHQMEKCHLTVAERGKILGEMPIPAPKKSVFDFVAKEDKQRLKDTQEFKKLDSKQNSIRTAGQTAGRSSTFKPFVKDPLKQERYERYLRIRAGQQDTSVLPDSGLTEWEREREREEFARAAMLYQPLSSTMAARFTSAKQPDEHNKVYEEVPAEEEADASDQAKAAAMKMFGHMTREKFEWHPDRLLCKRFNIPDPYPGSHVTGVPKIRREKFSLEDFVAVRAPMAAAHTQSPHVATESNSNEPSVTVATTRGSSRFSSVQQSVASRFEPDTSALPLELEANDSGETKKQNTDKNVNKVLHEDTSEPKERPSMDLFKAIFADSSSDESKESESEEDASEPTMQKVENKAVTPVVETQPDSTASPQVSHSEAVVVQGKEKELPPLQFIPRTKPTAKGKEVVLEKEKLDLDAGEYGPVLPSSSRDTGLGPSRAAISEKNLFSKSVVSGHRKKKRKHKKNNESETDTSDEDSKSQFTMKESKQRVERKKSDADFRSDSSKKKEKTVRKKSSKNERSYLSDSTSDSENDLPHRSVKYRFDESKKKFSFDKRETDSREKKEKHKKKRRHRSPDYSDEHHSRDKGRHRDRKHRRKGKEKSKEDRVKSTDRTAEEPVSVKQTTVSDNKQIIAKLKSIQDLRELKRMRAVDFM